MDKHEMLLAIGRLILETWIAYRSRGDGELRDQLCALECQRDHLMRELGIETPPRRPAEAA
jgi:hypothetical protein